MEGCGFKAFRAHVEALLAEVLAGPAEAVRTALDHLEVWWAGADEAGARRFALGLGRTLALALLVRQGQWALAEEQDPVPARAAVRFSELGLQVPWPA